MAGEIPDVYLRFEGFEGECNDKKHPGKEGWITVKSFNFGFGMQGADSSTEESGDETPAATPNGAPANQNQNPNQNQAQNQATPQPRAKPKRPRRAPMKSGPMTFDCISFSKSSDLMSHALMEACHDGTEIPMVELHACRYGGGADNEKVPFLHLVFEKVNLKSCKLNLATEGMPSEDIEFEYKKVEMKCMWTDNATGKPLTSQPITAGWDLQDQEEIDEEPDDGDD